MKIIYKTRQENLFQELINPNFKISRDYQILDQALSDDRIIKRISSDFPAVRQGRHRTAVEQTLRILVLKHQKQLSYRNLERQLTYDMEDRWLCKIDKGVPCFKTLQNQISCVGEDTIRNINAIVMERARSLKLTEGKRLRVDSTVTEMNIHYPTDASLIGDGIRMVGHLLGKEDLLPRGYRWVKAGLKRQMNLLRTVGRRNKEVATRIIHKVVSIGKKAIHQTRGLGDKIVQFKKQLLQRVIKQTEQVLNGCKQIKNRIVSLVEPTARVIRRGKSGKSAEFGKFVQIQEDEHFVTDWQVNDTKQDESYLIEALKRHRRIHKRLPREVATDRGYSSEENLKKLRAMGIQRIGIPKRGKCNKTEQKRQKEYWFKKSQRWRAGGEAKISWLKRKFGLNRSLNRGENGLGRWVGAGILANNLIVMAKMLAV